jgi:hypothetical protein
MRSLYCVLRLVFIVGNIYLVTIFNSIKTRALLRSVESFTLLLFKAGFIVVNSYLVTIFYSKIAGKIA